MSEDFDPRDSLPADLKRDLLLVKLCRYVIDDTGKNLRELEAEIERFAVSFCDRENEFMRHQRVETLTKYVLDGDAEGS